MFNSLTKEWEIAGSDPGQKIKLTIIYLRRVCRKVTVKYMFEVESLGVERFKPSERWNKSTLYVNDTPISWTYNLFGDRVRWKTEGELAIDNVGDPVVRLEVKYINERLGNVGSDKYTTGVIKLTSVGYVEIDPNSLFKVSFKGAFEDTTITELPNQVYDYWGRPIIVPPAPPVDPSGRYKCIGWGTEYSGYGVNLNKPTIPLGGTVLPDSDMALYACWEALPHKWRFYTDSTLDELFLTNQKEFPNPIMHKPGESIKLPDLAELDAKYDRLAYRRRGYKFAGWYWYDRRGVLQHGEYCDEPYECRFWPMWVANNIEIEFNFGFNNHKIIRTFKYDKDLDLSKIMIDTKGNLVSSPDRIRPGYTLVGWTMKVMPDPLHKAEVEALLGMTLATAATLITYTIQGGIYPTQIALYLYAFMGLIDTPKTRITLYAVWQYLPDAYVYTEGAWRYAVPYVYTEAGEEPGWKLCSVSTFHDNRWLN